MDVHSRDDLVYWGGLTQEKEGILKPVLDTVLPTDRYHVEAKFYLSLLCDMAIGSCVTGHFLICMDAEYNYLVPGFLF